MADNDSAADQRSLALEVAKRYYERGQKQEEIAGDTGLTQPQVSSLLKLAEKLGIVQKVIQAPLEIGYGDKIKQRYDHIQECLVIGYKGSEGEPSEMVLLDEMGKVGADHFLRHVRSNSVVGVSCGTSLWAMVNHLKEPTKIVNLEVASLSIWCGTRIYQIAPVAIVTNIMTKCPNSTGLGAHLPDHSADPKAAREEHEIDLRRVSRIFEPVENPDKQRVLYVGLGGIPAELGEHPRTTRRKATLDFSVLLQDLKVPDKLLQKMAGECCFQPYSIEGKILTSKEDDVDGALLRLETNVPGFPLLKLRKMVEDNTAVVCAIAGGPYKQRSVLGGLRAKIFNHLVTDLSCAEFVMGNF